MSAARFLGTARDLAVRASAEVNRLRDQPMISSRKPDQSLVTEADIKSDEIIRSGLEKAFPDHAILSEESGLGDKREADYVWLIDPLDGTKAYAKGIAGHCVMVGLLHRGEPVLGVVVDPVSERIYEAVRGEGAFLVDGMQRTKLHVSENHELKDMPVVVSTGFPEKKMAAMRASLAGPLLPPINSVGIKVGLLVRQEADIYVNHHSVHLWDTCAPQIILEEAGGEMTRLDGTPLRYELTAPYSHQSLTLASNGARQRELAALLSPLFDSPH